MTKCHYYMALSNTSAINGTIMPPSSVLWRKINYMECLWASEPIFGIVEEGGLHKHTRIDTDIVCALRHLWKKQPSPLNTQSLPPVSSESLVSGWDVMALGFIPKETWLWLHVYVQIFLNGFGGQNAHKDWPQPSYFIIVCVAAVMANMWNKTVPVRLRCFAGYCLSGHQFTLTDANSFSGARLSTQLNPRTKVIS